MATLTLLQSLQPLRTIIQQNLPALRSSPCLMVTSSTPVDRKQNNRTIDDFVQSSSQLLMSKNLRSVPITIDAAFPTSKKLDETLKLAHRAGAKDGFVLGIGSGAAIDLAKAVSTKLHGNSKDGCNLILAPATLAGVYAASSKQTILLDTDEETLMPSKSDCNAEIAFDSKYFSCAPLYTDPKKGALSMAHVAAALLSVALDTARLIDEEQVEEQTMQQIKAAVTACSSVLRTAAEHKNQQSSSLESQQQLIEAILLLSSLPTSSETMPQKAANALLPMYFPNSHILTYLGCMLPGLCETHGENGLLVKWLAEAILEGNNNTSGLASWAETISRVAGIPTMASLAYGTPDVNTLLDKVVVHETGGSETSLLLFSHLLQKSLNR